MSFCGYVECDFPTTVCSLLYIAIIYRKVVCVDSCFSGTRVSELFTFTYLRLINLLVVLYSYPHLVFLCVHFFMSPEYGGGALRAGVWCIAI